MKIEDAITLVERRTQAAVGVDENVETATITRKFRTREIVGRLLVGTGIEGKDRDDLLEFAVYMAELSLEAGLKHTKAGNVDGALASIALGNVQVFLAGRYSGRSDAE